MLRYTCASLRNSNIKANIVQHCRIVRRVSQYLWYSECESALYYTMVSHSVLGISEHIIKTSTCYIASNLLIQLLKDAHITEIQYYEHVYRRLVKT